MYSRKLDDRVLEFGHEGILFRNSFVMYDKETNSLWMHTTGEAIKGELAGKLLEFLPSRITSWKEWKTLHPFTRVLVGEKANTFMGSFNARRQRTRFGLAVGSGLMTRLYPYAELQARPILNDTFEGKNLVIVFDRASASATAFAVPGHDGKPVVFRHEEERSDGVFARDTATSSLWNAFAGRCIEGELKGKTLEPVPATAWLIDRWKGFYPDGEVYEAEADDGDVQ